MNFLQNWIDSKNIRILRNFSERLTSLDVENKPDSVLYVTAGDIKVMNNSTDMNLLKNSFQRIRSQKVILYCKTSA